MKSFLAGCALLMASQAFATTVIGKAGLRAIEMMAQNEEGLSRWKSAHPEGTLKLHKATYLMNESTIVIDEETGEELIHESRKYILTSGSKVQWTVFEEYETNGKESRSTFLNDVVKL